MTVSAIISVDAGARRVARRVVVTAPAADVFALVGDPHRHPELDGSGTVRDVDVKGPHHPAVGDKFTVGMKQYGLPYKIVSTVTEFRDGSVIEWQHPLGHRWRWDLVESNEGGATVTEVTETFDYSTAKVPLMITAFGYDKKNADGITATLQRLADRFA
ncbi:dimethyladenosine transferase [Mycolicibacterium sp. P1-18]|uniref:SRPBCC family protein n=1 Tax=Mycolicibacterium sp. P1-18 TaxID=2024615 RepID=UPI0011F38537|nr:SRPBCC family protein [Mycolicibacterium sp. P1-18]KAA0094587.1 dimethyladenosine transferase [Mycolicibacterium sp. P1-18]